MPSSRPTTIPHLSRNNESAREPSLNRVERRRKSRLGDGSRQRNILRTYLYAILCVSAIRNSAGPHHRFEPLILIHLACRVGIE